MGKIRKITSSLLKVNWQLKKDVIRITFLYLWVSCITRVLPVRWYYKQYFQNKEGQALDLARHTERLSRIRKIVCNLPGRYSCLKECIVVYLYYKRKGIYVPLYLGVNIEDGFKAHAWYDPKRSESFRQVDQFKNGKKQEKEMDKT